MKNPRFMRPTLTSAIPTVWTLTHPTTHHDHPELGAVYGPAQLMAPITRPLWAATSTVIDRLSARPWSRAGAIAAVTERMTQGPRRSRAFAFGARTTLHLMGVVVIAFGVAMMLWNNFGVGPMDVFIGAIRVRTGVPLAVAVYITVGMLLALAWLLGRRPGIGNLLTPLVLGPVLQLFFAQFQHLPAPQGLLMQVPVQLVAVAVIAIGAGATITANIGAGTAELLTAATSGKTGHSEPRVRLALEMSWFGIGALLGGPFGVGTVLVALTIGPAVARGYALVDGAVDALLSRRPAYA